MVTKLVENVRGVVVKAPNGVLLVCVTVFASVVVGAFTLIAVVGGDATELRALINTLLNVGALILSGGSFLYAGVAARSSNEAAENTNGKLEKTVHTAVKQALVDKEVSRHGRPNV